MLTYSKKCLFETHFWLELPQPFCWQTAGIISRRPWFYVCIYVWRVPLGSDYEGRWQTFGPHGTSNCTVPCARRFTIFIKNASGAGPPEMDVFNMSTIGATRGAALRGAYACLFLCVCMCVYVCMYMHTNMHMCIHTYIHTHILTYWQLVFSVSNMSS